MPYGASDPLLCADIETRLQPAASGLGVPEAISLVLGPIIGVGVFNLPASLAPLWTDQSHSSRTNGK